MVKNYQEGKIYCIKDNTNGNVYYGSTCEKYLSKRIAQHRNGYKLYIKTNKRYTSSFEILKNGDFDIELVEQFPCNSSDELLKRERYFIELNKEKCINKRMPSRTHEEFISTKGRDEINKDHKAWRDERDAPRKNI